MAIVEGPGDEGAIRVLLRRWFHLHQMFTAVEIRPLLTKGVSKLLVSHNEHSQHGVEYWVRKAQNFRPCAILVLLDADDECEQPRYRPHGVELGPWLLSRAQAIVGHIPISVVVADRCFESWFLCPPSQQMLMDKELFKTTDLAAAERARGRWESRLKALMGQSYSKAVDQARLAAHMPLGEEMASASRSFRKLRQELEKLRDLVSG